ncbi:MAG: hypothetical protein AUI91_03345 [Acidobacteria bacterium 13_1_40CM_3_56_11]|nr:MAG: hypothetical protein AUI91_03345 [Acidobacteria bacterium 13_1_40CM_3_56_11]
MSLEGRIIEFLDAEELRLAYVRKQERDRLHVIDPRGRNSTVHGDRVVIVHRPSTEGEFPALARQISEKVSARQSEVDVELLWQSVGTRQRELNPSELAELFFAETTPETESAVFRALSEDNLFFRRKGAQFLPKTEEQVLSERTRRQRQRAREEFREHVVKVLEQLLKKNTDIPEESGVILDRIQNWLRFKTGDEIGLILEEIAGAAKARDAAYDILLRAGRVDPTLDRFLVTAGIEPHFSSPLIQAAAQLTPYTHIPARLDYQDSPAFTIDDEDTQEVDDALTVRWEGDEIVVGIHIADVSAFVRKGDILDAEASRRSSTIYLPSITVPMFPERLSTDLASLRTAVPRPAFTVEVRFDKQANRAGYRIALSTINVQKRLSYDEADQIIESDPALYTLHRIAKQLRDARSNRGAITFRRAELKIRVKGDEIQITKINPNSPSRFVVSEMMILANGLAADFASVNSIPVIYRTQEPREALAVEDTLSPALDAVDSTKTAPSIRRDPQRDLKSPALDAVDSTKTAPSIRRDPQRDLKSPALDAVDSTKTAPSIRRDPQRDLKSPALDAVDSTAGRLRGSDITLSGTYKAVEALAFERLRKTQASSPIRRYADLVTQRQFTAMLSGVPVPYGREELLQILAAAETAEQEIRAIEDRSTNYWLLEYLARYKRGELLAAVVLDPKGNIELQDYYLRGRVSGPVKLRPGEMVDVRIETIDPAKGEVRFRAV